MRLLLFIAFLAIARAQVFETNIEDEVYEDGVLTKLEAKFQETADKLLQAIEKGKSTVPALFAELKQLYKDLLEIDGNARVFAKQVVAQLKEQLAKLKNNHVTPAVKLVKDFLNKVFNRGTRDLEYQDDVLTKLEAKFQETADKLLKAIEKGKSTVPALFAELRQLYKDLLEIDGNARVFAKQVVAQLKEHLAKLKNDHVTPAVKLVKEFLNKVLNRGTRDLEYEDGVLTKLEAKFQETADKLLKAIEKGKSTVPALFAELRQLYKDLLEIDGNARVFAKQVVAQLKEHLAKLKKEHVTPAVKLVKDFLNRVLNRGTRQTDAIATLEQKLKETSDKLVKAITEGKQGVLKLFAEFRQLYKDLTAIDGKARVFAKDLAEKVKVAIQKVKDEHLSPALTLIKNFFDKIFNRGTRDLEDDAETDKITKLEARLLEVSEKLTTAIKQGKQGISKLLVEFRKLYQQLKEIGGNAKAFAKVVADKLKQAIDKVKTEHISPAVKLVREFLKKVLNRGTRDVVSDLEKKLVEATTKLTTAIETGKGNVLKAFAEFRQLYKDLLEIDAGAKVFAKTLTQKIKEAIEKAKNDHISPAVAAVKRFIDAVFGRGTRDVISDLEKKLVEATTKLTTAIETGKGSVLKAFAEFRQLYKDLLEIDAGAKVFAKTLAQKVKEAIENAKNDHITPAIAAVKRFIDVVFGRGTRDVISDLEKKLVEATTKLTTAIETGKGSVLKAFAEFRQLYKDLLEIDAGAKVFAKTLAQKVKESIENAKNNHITPAVAAVKRFIDAVFRRGSREVDFEEDDVVALRRRGLIKDFFGKLFDTAKDIVNKLVTGLHGKFKELGQFLGQLLKDHVEKAKPHMENIKQLAKEFLGHAKEATLQTLEEAKEFFGNYKNDLGELWKKLLETINTAEKTLKATTPTPA